MSVRVFRFAKKKTKKPSAIRYLVTHHINLYKFHSTNPSNYYYFFKNQPKTQLIKNRALRFSFTV